jgi:hypothetical protein
MLHSAALRVFMSGTLACGLVFGGGCGGDARVDLAAAGAVESLATAMSATLAEYHADLEAADAARESDVVAAFISRIQRDAGDQAACRAHAEAFHAAMRRLRADEQVSWSRRHAAVDNVATLREVAGGLRRIAIESMSLNDEARRYVNWLVGSASELGNPTGPESVSGGGGGAATGEDGAAAGQEAIHD